MSQIFGMAGQLGAAAIQAGAMKDALQMQLDAVEKQRKVVYDELQPNKINLQSTAADIERAKNSLALQAVTDPNLLAARYAAEGKILQGVEGLGASDSDAVASQATSEILDQGKTGVAAQMKQKLIDAALGELEAGATLPNDVQAELVKAGLERSGAVTGAATSKGFGQNLTRQLVGERALALKSERQQRAAGLTAAADTLEQNRNRVMMTLFPELQQQQLNNLNAAGGALKASSSELAPVGLSGESIANIWLARVGATNQLTQSAGDAMAKNAAAQGQIWGNAVGGISNAAAQMGPSWSDVQGWFQSGPSSVGSDSSLSDVQAFMSR